MSRRSKREMAPPPQPFPCSSPSVPMPPAAPPGSSGPRCFLAPPASMNTMMGSAAPGPWWCGPPLPQQTMPWWPAPSCGGGTAASSSQPVQKDDIDSDPEEWQVPPAHIFASLFWRSSRYWYSRQDELPASVVPRRSSSSTPTSYRIIFPLQRRSFLHGPPPPEQPGFRPPP